ncbi:MAG: DUF4258 domain-containing protein [Spirochaetota bacterium]
MVMINHLKFDFTKHAEDVIKERRISLEFIERTILDPDLIENDISDINLEHRLKKIPEHEYRVLRIILNKNSDPLRIVTVFFDRSMRGKL